MTNAEHTPPDAPSPPGFAMPQEQLPRPMFVRLAILLAVAGTVFTVGAIGWRWYQVRFPDAAIFVRGDASADRALVVVTAEDGRTIFSGRLGADNQYGLVVLVEQGVFTVRADRDGNSLLATRLYVPNGGGVLLEVPPPEPAASQPASKPATAPAPAA